MTKAEKRYRTSLKGRKVAIRATAKYRGTTRGKLKTRLYVMGEDRHLALGRYNASEKGKENSRRGQEVYRNTLHGRFMLARKAATYRDKAWEIKEHEYTQLIKQPCTYCTRAISHGGIGLDRIDNSRGYSVDNVLPCCGVCNRLRGNWLTVDETRVAIQAVIQFRLTRDSSSNSLQTTKDTDG